MRAERLHARRAMVRTQMFRMRNTACA
jgi:hypothetical protein